MADKTRGKRRAAKGADPDHEDQIMASPTKKVKLQVIEDSPEKPKNRRDESPLTDADDSSSNTAANTEEESSTEKGIANDTIIKALKTEATKAIKEVEATDKKETGARMAPIEDKSPENPFNDATPNKQAKEGKESENKIKSPFKKGMTFGDHFKKSASGTVGKASPIVTLPETCEVTREELQDELLKESYEGLVPLRAGQLESWGQKANVGLMRFSDWGDCHAYEAVTFQKAGRYINPARVDPRDLVTVHLQGQDFLHLASDATLAICLTPIRVTMSYLTEPEFANGKEKKYVTGIMHSQEYERACGVYTMMFRVSPLAAQLNGDELSFTTRIANAPGSGGHHKGYQSPATVRVSSASNAGFFRPVLNPRDEVIVYDARSSEDFGLQSAEQINSLKDKLPRFDGDIPSGSFALVAHTASKWCIRYTERVKSTRDS
ncbi:hypothetical protein ONZ45_g4326 [Pleurotus djamor]|nr:hypothetical protein ONZ45_g4326 [Pleurotus djamor]